MNAPKKISRYKAAAIHVGISALIALVVGALLFGVWFPPPYFRISGGEDLILILVGIDLVIGPLLTLIVFVQGKKGLKFDLAVIGVLQVAALVYGMYIIVQARPVYVVAAVDRFTVVPANAIDPADLAKAAEPRWRNLPWTGPRLVGAELPTDEKERNELMDLALKNKDVDVMPKYYVDIARAQPDLKRHGKTIAELLAFKTTSEAVVRDALRGRNLDAANVVWVPIVAQQGDMTMLLDAATGAPLFAIDVYPWNDGGDDRDR